jgi:hypothetical protein
LGINVPSVHSSISRPVAFPLRWSSAYILYQIAHTLGIGSPKIWMEFVPGGVNVCLGSITFIITWPTFFFPDVLS